MEKKTSETIKLPHEGVYVRLAPSKIHGIGVVAIMDIPKGVNVFGNDDTIYKDYLVLNAETIDQLPNEALKELYKDFCVIENGVYYCPTNFNEMSLDWFLNNSSNPNCKAVVKNKDTQSNNSSNSGEKTTKDGIYFYSLRDIKAGEELTVSYDTYSELP